LVEVQAGRRPTADAWLAKAEALAATDEELAAIGGVRGMHASDMGDYPTAFRYLEGSVELARGCGDQRQRAWSLSILARAHLLRDERSQAAAARGDLGELVVRAQLHRCRLGDPAALASARLLAAGIDNPALTPLLDGVRSGA
jgi:hypothetical protein